jgi:arsenate reductase-like glutaredoxin family protein
MDWQQKRLKDLNKRLLNKIELLGEYEKELDYEKEPSDKRRLQDAIQKLKDEIEVISVEAEELAKSTTKETDEHTSGTSLNLVEIRQQYYDEYIARKRKEEN